MVGSGGWKSRNFASGRRIAVAVVGREHALVADEHDPLAPAGHAGLGQDRRAGLAVVPV